MDPLNAVSHKAAVYVDVSTSLIEDLLWHLTSVIRFLPSSARIKMRVMVWNKRILKVTSNRIVLVPRFPVVDTSTEGSDPSLCQQGRILSTVFWDVTSFNMVKVYGILHESTTSFFRVESKPSVQAQFLTFLIPKMEAVFFSEMTVQE
jgi:hypothetical protein